MLPLFPDGDAGWAAHSFSTTKSAVVPPSYGLYCYPSFVHGIRVYRSAKEQTRAVDTERPPVPSPANVSWDAANGCRRNPGVVPFRIRPTTGLGGGRRRVVQAVPGVPEQSAVIVSVPSLPRLCVHGRNTGRMYDPQFSAVNHWVCHRQRKPQRLPSASADAPGEIVVSD
jgi:hypothetical protein